MRDGERVVCRVGLIDWIGLMNQLGTYRSHRDTQDRRGEVMTSCSIVHMYEPMRLIYDSRRFDEG